MRRVDESRVMEDSFRAAHEKYKISTLHNKISAGPEKLEELVDKYRTKAYDEDIEFMKALGGANEIADKIGSSLENGLKGDDFEDRESFYGSNRRDPPERTPFCKFFLGALDDFMLKLLLVCAVISIAFEMGFVEETSELKTAWIEGTGIFAAVFVVAFVGSYNDYKKEEQFLKLNTISEQEHIVTVLRRKKEQKVHYNHIQVGDLIKIRYGMNIPVDGLVIKGSGITSNESAMTGEPEEIPKDHYEGCMVKKAEKDEEAKQCKSPHKKRPKDLPSPILLSGTQIQAGDGWFMAIMVGQRSCLGKILASLEQEVESTPLQQKLEAIGSDIGKIGIYCAVLTVHVLFFRFFIERLANREMDCFGGAEDIGVFQKEEGALKKYLDTWIHYFIIGITIVVVAVPEGLPLAVMISLAYSVRRMLADQNFVKRLASCEIMGGANNICSDKTGTLTKNQMTVTNIWIGKDSLVKVAADRYMFKDYSKSKFAKSIFCEAVAVNTIGSVDEATPTEKALIQMVEKLGINIESLRKKHLAKDYVRFHFNGKRKKMSTIIKDCGETAHGYDKRIHMKGASEIVLGSCTHYLNQDGKVKLITDETRKNIEGVIQKYANQALRTISIAYKDLQKGEGGRKHLDVDSDTGENIVEQAGFTLITIVGIKDIIREEVPDAVITCQRAGIVVRMVTGDNKTTATAIAKECNIITPDVENDPNVVMEGIEFSKKVGGLWCKNCRHQCPCECPKDKVKEGVKKMGEFIELWKVLRVLARSRPEDKYLLVTALKEVGEVVAVTGDGTNDAPAMKKADVGFAMGITGTDVAKQAADIILMDDNFASIIKACMWGRNIYENIRKFLLFQLTINVVAMVTAFLGSCVLVQSPLHSIQLLWLNLIMDSLGSLALATERPKVTLLDRPPHRREEYIINRKMMKHIIGMSIYQLVLLYAIVFAGEHFYPEPSAQWRFERAPLNNFVYPGRLYDWDGSPLYVVKEDHYGVSRHMTNVFNIFVVMQIFNMINARKINDEPNVFEGFFENKMFLLVWVAIILMQIVIIEIGSNVMQVSPGGLPWQHWLIACALGVTVWIWEYFLKLLPDTLFPQFGDKETDPLRQQAYLDSLGIRKNRSESFRLKQPQMSSHNSSMRSSRSVRSRNFSSSH